MSEYRLTPDRTADSASEIQAAVDAGRPVRIAAGEYELARTVRLPSGARILAEPEARLRLADGACRNADDYMLTNADPEVGNENIEIRGGVWDGNNRGNPRPQGLFDDGYTGSMFHFENVRGLHVGDIIMQNAEAYHLRATAVREFTFDSIAFSSDRIRPNNDGVHLGGECEDGTIRNLRGLQPGVTGDDLVALNADDALNRTEVRGMRGGPIRRLRIETLRAEGCHCFVRLLSVFSPIEDITIRDVYGSCSRSAINCDAARGCRVPVFDEDNPPYSNGVGRLHNVSLSNIRVGKMGSDDSPLLRLETRSSNFVIEDFERLAEQPAEAPTFRIKYMPETLVYLDGDTREMSGHEAFESGVSRIGRLSLNASA